MPETERKMPQIQFGPHTISRLICGANPFNGGSHLSVFVNRQMCEYYSPKQILKTLRRCQEVGINCWQASPGNCDLYRRHVAEGGKMRYIAIHSGTSAQIKKLADGSIFGAEEAKKEKLIDDVGYLDDAIALVKSMALIMDAKVVEYRKPMSLFGILGVHKSDPLKIDKKTLHELRRMERMYLWEAY